MNFDLFDILKMNFDLFDILKKNQNNTIVSNKKNPDIHVISGCIGSGKSTLIPYLKEYLNEKNRKVYCVKEFTTDTIVDEMNYFYKMVELYKNDKVRLTGIYFWIQDKIISEYENFIKSFEFEKYDDIIFERTYFDTIIFTKYGITDESIKDFHFDYLNEKINKVNEMMIKKSLKFNNVIYINTNGNNCIKRINKRIVNNDDIDFDRKGEKNLDMINFHNLYENDFKYIYQSYVSFDNNMNLSNENLKENLLIF